MRRRPPPHPTHSNPHPKKNLWKKNWTCFVARRPTGLLLRDLVGFRKMFFLIISTIFYIRNGFYLVLLGFTGFY